ncbi:30S ribosomal protein S9 [Elusimicrobiota bacterium]
MPPKTQNQFNAVGKRKTSVAQIIITVNGSGNIVVNGKTLDKFFGNRPWQKAAITSPLEAVSLASKIDVVGKVHGGGVTGQAHAMRHGIARCLAQIDAQTKQVMRKKGFLTRDSRIVERKKPGRPKARKRFQFSKR